MSIEMTLATTGPHATAEPLDPQGITDRLRAQLSAAAFARIQRIREAEEPERRVRGGARNFVIDLTSRLMRRTMRMESNLEAAWARVIGEEQRTLEIYEQAMHVKFRYPLGTGEVEIVEETIDLMFLQDDEDAIGITFASCMMETELQHLAEKLPWRYVHDGNGWHDRPLAWYFEKTLGAQHHLLIDEASIDILLHNLEYTERYRTNPIKVDDEVRAAVAADVRTYTGDTAEALLKRVAMCTAAELCQLIVDGNGVWCDEHREPMSEPWRLHLYPAPILVRTVGRLPRPRPIESSVLDLTDGGQFRLGAATWTVVSHKDDTLICKNEMGRFDQFSRQSIEDDFYNHKGAVATVPREPGSAVEEIGSMGDTGMKRLVGLSELVLRLEAGEDVVLTRGEEEALRAYRRLVADSQDPRGAFTSRWQDCGRRGSRISEVEKTLVKKVAAAEQLRKGARGEGGPYAVYHGAFKNLTPKEQMEATRSRHSVATVAQAMSRPSFRRLLRELHNDAEVAQAQQGHRAANALQLRRPVGGGTGVPGRGFTSRGLYPGHKGYVDTLVTSLWAVDAVTGEKRRLRLTAFRDGYSKRTMAGVLEPHEPNAETYLALFREVVEQHQYFPRICAMDNAKLHDSQVVREFLATMFCKRERGPKGHGRYRSEIESVFHSVEARVRLLSGGIQPIVDARALAASHASEDQAIWPSGMVEDDIVMPLLYEEFNNKVDPIDDMSPQQRWDQGLQLHGQPETDRVAFDAIFLMNSAPRVKTKGAHAGKLKVTTQGVRGEKGEHFTCEALADPALVGSYVDAWREPFDISKRYVRVNGKRHVAISEALAHALRGRTPREVRALSRQIRERLGHEPSVTDLGAFIVKVRQTEAELRAAAKRARLMAPLEATDNNTEVSTSAALAALRSTDPSTVADLPGAPVEAAAE